MERKQLLLERLKTYTASDIYPFHMPGHKRNYGESLNPFSIDITEIEGFDNLHNPKSILKESMEWAASVYGADRTYYLINGSTCGILSAISAAVHPNGKILMARNCHKSAFHAVILNRLETIYIYPQIVDKLGIAGGILSEKVEKVLKKNPDIQAVLIVSPTYNGIISDIEKISEIVHKNRIPLIVDEAHGAHIPFSPSMKSAMECGADIVIQSLHKTLPSLTQTAVLHVKEEFVDIGRLERYLQIYQSSSPSYIFMASIEQCIYEMDSRGRESMDFFEKRILRLRKELSELKNMRILGKDICGEYGVYDVDESKLLVSVKNCFYEQGCIEEIAASNKYVSGAESLLKEADGNWLMGVLRNRYHLEMEMAGADYVLAIMSYLDTEESFLRIRDALYEIDRILIRKNSDLCFPDNISLYTKIPAALALEMPWEPVPVSECAGRVSSEFVCLYPPGIPIIVPGEILDEDVIGRILQYKKKGFPIQGMADENADYLRVLIPLS